MIRMSQVFGFDYTPPKWYKAATAAQSPGLGQHHGGTPLDTTGANGTVLPGRSIGRDNLHYYNQEGEGLHLAGGEAIMVPEWVDQLVWWTSPPVTSTPSTGCVEWASRPGVVTSPEQLPLALAHTCTVSLGSTLGPEDTLSSPALLVARMVWVARTTDLTRTCSPACCRT
jgi:hypothetical protein